MTHVLYISHEIFIEQTTFLYENNKYISNKTVNNIAIMKKH